MRTANKVLLILCVGLSLTACFDDDDYSKNRGAKGGSETLSMATLLSRVFYQEADADPIQVNSLVVIDDGQGFSELLDNTQP